MSRYFNNRNFVPLEDGEIESKPEPPPPAVHIERGNFTDNYQQRFRDYDRNRGRPIDRERDPYKNHAAPPVWRPKPTNNKSNDFHIFRISQQRPPYAGLPPNVIATDATTVFQLPCRLAERSGENKINDKRTLNLIMYRVHHKPLHPSSESVFCATSTQNTSIQFNLYVENGTTLPFPDRLDIQVGQQCYVFRLRDIVHTDLNSEGLPHRPWIPPNLFAPDYNAFGDLFTEAGFQLSR